ncbi:MAG: enoyl-CoA hydratase/isomerase family protein [Myxococcota bacterium]
MEIGSYAGFEAAILDPGIARLTFNEPERLNGMTSAMKRDLVEVLLQAQLADEVRVVLFTGSGRAFCAGDDLRAYGRPRAPSARMPPLPPGHQTPIGTYDGLRGVSQAVNRAIRDLDKLTIAAINGVAIQTGLSLALACDFRIASTEARLGSATLRFGLLPDEGGQYLLVELLGVARTLDFVMRKRIVSAEEALELGLVHEVVAPGALMARAMALAEELARGPQVAMRLLKRSIYNAAELGFSQALDEIAAKTAISDHHPDVREGVSAFFEKRQPRFNRWLEKDGGGDPGAGGA